MLFSKEKNSDCEQSLLVSVQLGEQVFCEIKQVHLHHMKLYIILFKKKVLKTL